MLQPEADQSSAPHAKLSTALHDISRGRKNQFFPIFLIRLKIEE